MPKSKPEKTDPSQLVQTWSLPSAATLGSSVRAKGLLLEVRARLPLSARKSLEIDAGVLALAMPESSSDEFRHVCAVVVKVLDGIENLPVIPREIEDILSISTAERRRWLADGRLPSFGMRTVKLRGRAKKITFHVFDPRLVEDIQNRGIVEDWREEDAVTALENRRRAAYKAKLTRSLKNAAKAPKPPKDSPGDSAAKLRGWEEFGRDGFLR